MMSERPTIFKATMTEALVGTATTRGARRRRAIATIAIYVAIGLLLTLVGAVAGVARGTSLKFQIVALDADDEARWIASTMPAPFVEYARTWSVHRWELTQTLDAERFLIREEMMDLAPRDNVGGIIATNRIAVWRLRAGWPWPALEMSSWSSTGLGDIAVGMWKLPLVFLGLPGFPVGVKPLGVVADALVLGAGAWLLLRVPRTLRSVRRARGGACRTCGHALAGLPRCPECGAAAAGP